MSDAFGMYVFWRGGERADRKHTDILIRDEIPLYSVNQDACRSRRQDEVICSKQPPLSPVNILC